MTQYIVKVISQEVHNWTDEGQGDYVCSKGGFTIGKYNSLEEAKEGINDYFDYDLSSDDYQEEYVTANRIEDVDAYPDQNGGYLVEYVMQILKQEAINFDEM